MELKLSDPIKHIQAPPAKYSGEDKAKIAKASRDFESLMTQMLLKSMNSTKGGLFGDEGEGLGGGVLDTLFESEIASFMTKNKGLGIAEMMYMKMTGEKLPVNLESLKPETSVKMPKVQPQSEAIMNNEVKSSIAPSGSMMTRLDKYEGYIDEASKKFGVDKNIIKSVILAESAGKSNAVSKANAKGLMQLMDGTAKDMGVNNSWDPKENIFGGTKYLANMLRKYKGDINLALAAYNAGPGNVDKHKGIPPFKETKTYITRVLGYYNHLDG